jgi:hypothetical protein
MANCYSFAQQAILSLSAYFIAIFLSFALSPFSLSFVPLPLSSKNMTNMIFYFLFLNITVAKG